MSARIDEKFNMDYDENTHRLDLLHLLPQLLILSLILRVLGASGDTYPGRERLEFLSTHPHVRVLVLEH